MKTALLMMIFVAIGSALSANPSPAYENSDQRASGGSSHVSCEMVRAYVGQLGWVQAKALARAAGMTASQEWKARRCLQRGINLRQ
jgi:hypothetical protein